MDMRIHAFRLLHERSLQMPELHSLLTGLAFGESPRWHDGRLWVADWAAHELLAVDSDGVGEVIARVPMRFQVSIDWRPGGEPVVVSGAQSVRRPMEEGRPAGNHGALGL